MSSGEYVYIRQTGGRDWRVVVRDGTLTDLDEVRFNEEVNSGFHALRNDCRAKVAELRDKHLRCRPKSPHITKGVTS